MELKWEVMDRAGQDWEKRLPVKYLEVAVGLAVAVYKWEIVIPVLPLLSLDHLLQSLREALGMPSTLQRVPSAQMECHTVPVSRKEWRLLSNSLHKVNNNSNNPDDRLDKEATALCPVQAMEQVMKVTELRETSNSAWKCKIRMKQSKLTMTNLYCKRR